MSPQMLILRQPGSDIDHFLAEYCNFQKYIGPKSDSMSYRQVLPRMPQRKFLWQQGFYYLTLSS
jgi:hypothetical protein